MFTIRNLALLLLVFGGACDGALEPNAAELDASNVMTPPGAPDGSVSGPVIGGGVALDGAAPRIDGAVPPAFTSDGAVPPMGNGCAECVRPPPTAAWDMCAQLAKRAGMSLPPERGVSFARLLCETADLDRFAGAPAHPYRAKLASSYDRKSTLEGAEGWFGNADHTSYVRDEGDEHVMMESVGAGVITRIWSPNPSGVLRIYVDYRTNPVIEAPMADLLAGKFESPWGEPFVFSAAQGYSVYLPIPFSRYARVATTSSAPLYYQVNYREYAAGTNVEPFSLPLFKSVAPLVKEIATSLGGGSSEALAQLPVQERTLSATTPEQTFELGPAVVREFTVRGFDPSEQALRGTRLTVFVDDERTIDAPLGDLFGAGPGLREHDSLVTSMHKDVLTLRWPMPVKGKLTIRAQVNGVALAPLSVRLRYSQGLPKDYRLFHAQWTGARSFDTTKPLDWTLIHFVGAGWYVGTSLNVTNPTAWWWGEGDEKIFIDGEPFPSNFGTGTEDYFGFGWCSNELFARPWIGQTRADGPLNQGRSSQYRWHIGDAIPFNSELRMSFEVLHWISGQLSISLTQDAVAYWYASPGGSELAAPLDISAFKVPQFEPLDSWLPPGIYNCRN